MITGAEQWIYVIAAYAVTALVIGGLSIWIIVEATVRARALRDLEARGVRRRSQG